MATNGVSYQKLLFDSTFIIASVTGMLYFLGYLYYKTFFDRLSIPSGSIDLSISQCITVTILPFASLIAGVMVLFILDSPKFKNKFEGKWIRIVSLLILIFLAIIIFVNWQMWMLSYMMAKILLLICVLLALVLMICIEPRLLPYFIAITVFAIFQLLPVTSTNEFLSLYIPSVKLCIGLLILCALFNCIESKEIEIPPRIAKMSDAEKSFTLIFIIVTFCYFSAFMGAFNAHYMLEGSSSDALKINISLKDTNNTLFENKTLVLVMLRDDHYYIIEEDRNHTKKPKLHIISSDQIKTVTVYEKGKGPITDLISN